MFQKFIFVFVFLLFPFDGLCRVNLIEQNGEISKLIQSGNFSSLLSIIAEREHEELDELIEASYASNIENFASVLAFIQNWPESDRLNGYEAIFKLMERDGHLWTSQGFKLAFAISRFDPAWPLAQRFPETIYKLYFYHNANCLLKNLEFNEYYYAAHAHFSYDKKRRRNFCWIKGSKNTDSVYDVRVVNDDVFTLRSAYYDEYLYAEEALFAHSTERRRVFTFRVKPIRPVGSDWHFMPQEGQQNVVKIRNTRYDELLYADGNIKYNKNRREVFTERITGHASERWTLWSVEC